MVFGESLYTLPGLRPKRDIRVNVHERDAVQSLAAFLEDLLRELDPGRARPLVVLAIGSDRSTGDSLGPLVGTRLAELAPGLLPVFGTLDEPVHAVNLSEKLAAIERTFSRPLIIAVDACLGQLQNVGTIALGKGSLRPGTGVNKELPPVGEIFISGVVNIGGFLEYLVLQNTRLSLVMKMADCITRALIIGGVAGARGGIRK
ncbi:MAG: spore protease YyaC [Bacillota bacterium]|jgi:putative sporulation protein YyaC|nr:spore protease YyaC [Bacillota bacterium]